MGRGTAPLCGVSDKNGTFTSNAAALGGMYCRIFPGCFLGAVGSSLLLLRCFPPSLPPRVSSFVGMPSHGSGLVGISLVPGLSPVPTGRGQVARAPIEQAPR